MSGKQTIYIATMVGLTVGSFIPALWGASLISVSSILFSGLGGIVGLWIGYQMSL